MDIAKCHHIQKRGREIFEIFCFLPLMENGKSDELCNNNNMISVTLDVVTRVVPLLKEGIQ